MRIVFMDGPPLTLIARYEKFRTESKTPNLVIRTKLSENPIDHFTYPNPTQTKRISYILHHRKVAEY
ncbi:predicted protein [Sclerotinia sclerotiorum 1980 UF-70]|uniref:Uncharacterized protein n=1 Tax=Sclerotinia sclerotiorum (strain ATCC 18683 / 1980 / Ss-1) TaxID=665079 RepID=A7EN94_SCLS1|nr:predicted protein [Sclerotinia sclerotiorum 1980 UF-70]EDO04310.1 predicted protein [Sclerotinia sclerotiorum 1980 UF-70]